MRDAGELIQLSRGLYRLADLPLPAEPDLVAVAQRVPNGVVCLISALAIHELTDQIPHAVHIAVARNSRPPRIDYPPVRAYRFDDAAFGAGVEERAVDDATIRVYGPEKTIADSFKFRREVGKDVALEALRRYVRRGRPRLDELLRYARICRVEKVVRPALEALL
jgi:predicted transcriptional regulator of viral defense system